MNKFVMRSLAAVVLMSAAGVAAAQTATTTFNVTATVNDACVVSAADLAFGVYSPDGTVGGNDASASSNVDVRCTNNTPFTVALDDGTTGTFAQRLLTSGTDTLAYNLYTDVTHNTIWGDGTTEVNQSGTGAGLAIGNEQVLTVYGLLPDVAANQNAAAGSYSDQITVTVTF